MINDPWSDDPNERLAGALHRGAGISAELTRAAPMRPWPYGMPCVINPYVVFLGLSPGDSPAAGDANYSERNAYEAPTYGRPHPQIYYKASYFDRIRFLGRQIVRQFAPSIRDVEADALIGQLNLGTGAFGQARVAAIEPVYGRWVPRMLKDHLKPRFVILLGTKAKLEGTEGSLFDPDTEFGINWKRPDTTVSFHGYTSKTYSYRIWNQKRADQKPIHFVMWPQHPSRAPMTNLDVWEASGREFVEYFERCSG